MTMPHYDIWLPQVSAIMEGNKEKCQTLWCLEGMLQVLQSARDQAVSRRNSNEMLANCVRFPNR